MNRTIISFNRKIVIHDIPSTVQAGKETMSVRAALMIEMYIQSSEKSLNIHHVRFSEIEEQYNTLTMKQLLQAE
ncbi:MAG: hypothetical protein ABS939_00515 [Psychrobacillus sp.]